MTRDPSQEYVKQSKQSHCLWCFQFNDTVITKTIGVARLLHRLRLGTGTVRVQRVQELSSIVGRTGLFNATALSGVGRVDT